jgi:catechol 2,3-dioxygenase-like lactoylglutathione lyase family enzyme
MPAFAQTHPINDVVVLVRDIETSVAFYRDRLGFELWHRAPGFADFTGAGLTLALWEREHLSSNTGAKTDRGQSNMLIAVKFESPAALDAAYRELADKGVIFVSPPGDTPWNAWCAYFHGPDGEVWELYAWQPGGAPGTIAP